jgi:hypothetical protein
MKIFNAAHFLRHISMPTLREFTDAHPLGQSLAIDWSLAQELLPALVIEAVARLEAAIQSAEMAQTERESIGYKLHLWHDDLRRAYLMSNDLSIQEFQTASFSDSEAQDAFASRDAREQSLWMLTFRDTAFRNAEMHIAFQAKSNGKYWKKHRIQPGLDPMQDRSRLDAFCHAVAKLYKSVGGGDGTYIEVSKREADGSVQLTIYIEGPLTAIAHFSESSFKRINTRIALETALVYQPSTGFIETIVKGGAKNHGAVLELFGKYVVEQEIKPEEIEKTRYKLNVLRDGMMEPFEDWSAHGVEKVRLRRARFTPMGRTGISFEVEAPQAKDQGDAIWLALGGLKVHHSFESEYNMSSASVIIYTRPTQSSKAGHFSFDISSTGSSTIKNLADKNQPTALAVLRALNVIEAEQVAA